MWIKIIIINLKEKRFEMKVLLSTLNSKYIHTALSLRYLKAFAEQKLDDDIEIAEYTINQSINQIIGEIYRKSPDVLAFSVYIWNVNEILKISEAIKLLVPNVKIVLGGPEVSFDTEKLMIENSFIDIVVSGEGELTFAEVLSSLKGEMALEEVDGISYRDEESVVLNSPRTELAELSKIPSVYGEQLGAYENKIIYYESSRGCPFNCKFCLSSTIKGVRFFDLKKVKRDLKIFIDGKVKQVKFIDRTFNTKKAHAMEILRYISENDNGYTNFHFEITAHLLDDEMISFLSELPPGLVQFEIGVQSTNCDTIEAINRTTDFEKLSAVVMRLRKPQNIHLHLDLIAGLPYEGYSSFQKSFDDVYRLKPEKLQLGFLKLLKGSSLRAEGELHGYKFLDVAPYEILESRYMSYKEMLKIKDIEELVEIYGNEKDFELTVSHIVENIYRSPFEFYETFSDYWRECGHYDSPHSKVIQYRILLEFIENSHSEEFELLKEKLRFDFVRNTRSPNVPEFLGGKENELSKNEKFLLLKDESVREKYFGSIDERDYNNLHKKLHFERFSQDMWSGSKVDSIYMFDYNVIERGLQKSRVIDIKKDIERVTRCLD